jgi:hypothetical protein
VQKPPEPAVKPVHPPALHAVAGHGRGHAHPSQGEAPEL